VFRRKNIKRDFLILKKHQASGNPVVEPLAVLGKPDHEESDKDNQYGNELCKVPKGNACKGWFVPLKIGHDDAHQQFTGGGLAAG
jgi:hypothetical protein